MPNSKPDVLVSLASLLAVSIFVTSVHGAEVAIAGKEGSARMEAARDEVANVRSNIFLTLLELDRVRGQGEAGLPQFMVFTNQLGRMGDLARAFGKRAEEMKQRGNGYFVDWERTTARTDSADNKERTRIRNERKASYDAINKSMQNARKNFLPFMDALTQIKTLLEGKRDEKGIAAAKALFMKANWRCIDVQRALLELEREFDRLAASFAKDNS